MFGRLLKQYYAVLPMANMRNETKGAIKPELLALRREQRRASLMSEEPEFESSARQKGPEYSMKLVKQLIIDIVTLADSGQLHKTLAASYPPPLLKIAIVSKRARHLLTHGRRDTMHTLTLPSYDAETLLPRVIRENQAPRTIRILNQKTTNSLIYPLFDTGDECKDIDFGPGQEPVEVDGILSAERLGWVGAGRDKSSLQPWPDLLGLEKGLQSLLCMPLHDISQIPEVAHYGSSLISINTYEPLLQDLFLSARDVLETSLYAPLAVLAILRQYEYLAQENQGELLAKLINSHIDDYTGLGIEMRTIQSDLRALQTKFPDSLNFGILELDLRPAKCDMLHNGRQLLTQLLQELVQEYCGLLNHSSQLFQSLCDGLRKVPTTVEELRDMSEYIDTQQDKKQYATVMATLSKADKVQQILNEFQQPLDPTQMLRSWQTKIWSAELTKTRSRMLAKLAKIKPMFVEQVVEDSQRLREMVQTNTIEMEKFYVYREVAQAEEYAGRASQVLATLHQASEEISILNSREKVLGLPLTDLGDFSQSISAFQSHSQLWTFAKTWTAAYHEWHFKSFRLVSAEGVETRHREGLQLLLALEKEVGDLPAPLSVVRRLKTQVIDFEQYVRVISQLRHPSIRDRHWEVILKALQLSVKTESVTLDNLVCSNILDHKEVLESVCHRALNEYAVEMVLEATEVQINTFLLDMKRDNVFQELIYLEGLTEAENVIQELLATLKFLTVSSKYVSQFKVRLDKATSSLVFSLQVLRDLSEMQENWLQLYPVLQFPELAQVISRDSDLMEDLQVFYTRQLTLIFSTQTLTASSDLKIKSFVEANDCLEALTKKVKKVLSDISQSFPRLQLLSHKELALFLTGLSRHSVLHLDMLFPGISPLSPPTFEITSVYHRDFELKLSQPVQLQSSKGLLSPEQWLTTLDISLKKAFQSEVIRLLGEAEEDRKEWWRREIDPQVALVTQQVLFSKGVSKYGKNEVEKAVGELSAELKEVLSLLITEIRPIYGTPGQSTFVMFKRATDIEAKIAKRHQLEKLAIQVISQLHILAMAQSNRNFLLDSFLWKGIVVLEPRVIGKSLELQVNHFDLKRQFGFEWLPLPLPLFVPTPITERCLLNMATGLKNRSSVMLLGASGASKSETLHELALLHGRHLFCWTIARGTHPTLIIQTLVGCVGAGSWMCLEEMQLLDSFVLNSLAYYLGRVREADTATSVTIEDFVVRMQPGFAFWGMSTEVNITLPARIQEQFRCVAMVQPDLSAVAEVRLYVLGLRNPGLLAKKIARALTSLSTDCEAITQSPSSPLRFAATVRVVNQLVSRIVSILDMFPVTDEKYLVNNAFRRELGIGLPRNEEVLFDEFLATMFRSPHNNIVAGTAVLREMEKMTEIMDQLKVETSASLVRTLRYLWVSISEPGHNLIILTGPPGAGKTTVIRTIAQVYSVIAGVSFSIPVISGLVSAGQIHKLIQACANNAPMRNYHCMEGFQQENLSPKDWICLDSAGFDSEALISVGRNDVYLQKELRIQVPESLKVLIETDSLSSATPGLISSSIIVHCSEGGIEESAIFHRVLTSELSFPVTQLFDLFESYFKKILKSAIASQPVLPLPARLAGLTLAKWVVMLLQPGKPHTNRLTHLFLETRDLAPKPRTAMMDGSQSEMQESAWVLALISGLGTLLTAPAAFDQAVISMCEDEPANFAHGLRRFLTESGVTRLSEVCFNFKERRWTLWKEFAMKPEDGLGMELPSYGGFVMVPTRSTMRLRGWMQVVCALHYDVVVIGPHQSGKSLIVSQVLRKQIESGVVSVIPLNVLLNTSCETLQYFIESRMDEIHPHKFCALGRRHHYVFLEDMNMDTHRIYDLLRFFKENQGWYYKDRFDRIEDLTICLSHSYTLDKRRPLDLRSLRQFVLLYKERYDDEEVGGIFKAVAPASIDIERLCDLYVTGKTDLLKGERSWQHTTLSNYMQALKWLQFSTNWPSMLQRYFLDQLLPVPPPLFFIPSLVLSPSTPPGFFSEFTSEAFPVMMETYHKMMDECDKKHADSMKVVHKVILRPGERLGRQLYLFGEIVGDLASGQHCVVSTLRELRIIRAVTLMAAELIGNLLVDIRLFDVSAAIVNSFATSDLGYIPTDAKFDMKNIIERAVQGKKSVCLVTIDDESDLTSPVFHSFMDLLSDILLGKDVKLIGAMKRTANFGGLYPDQVTQVQRELIQENITVCLLVQTGNFEFSRFGGRKGPLEILKHDYRAVFNLCRIMNFDEVDIPPLLLSLVSTLREPSEGCMEVFKRMAENIPAKIDDFTVERIAYISRVMQQSEEQRLTSEIEQLRSASRWCSDIDLEAEKSTYILDLQTRIDDTRKTLLNYRKITRENSKSPTMVEATVSIEKKAFLEVYDRGKEKVKRAIAEFKKTGGPLPPSSVSPSDYILLAGAFRVVYSDLPPFPFQREDQYAVYCKDFPGKWKDFLHKLPLIDPSQLPDLSAYIPHSPQTESPLFTLLSALAEMRELNMELGRKNANWLQQAIGSQTGSGITSQDMYAPEAAGLQMELTSLDEELQQAMALRPKILRLSSDLKGVKGEWDSRCDSVAVQLSHSRGNSLLAASLFVLGLSLVSAPRNTIRVSMQQFLRTENILFDTGEGKEDKGTSPFLMEGVGACLWIWKLTLPYPLFIDPYGMAANLVPDREKIVYLPSSDQRFEEVLFQSMAEGSSLIIVEPTESMWQYILPLVKWRYDRSVEAARGEEIKSTPVMYRKKPIMVDSDFRFYISQTTKPSDTLSQFCTVISFEPHDPISWRTSILLHTSEDFSLIPAYQIPSKTPKEELLAFFSASPPGPIYSLPVLAGVVKAAMRIDTYESDRLKLGEEADDPAKSIYVELLSVAVELNDLLQELDLGAWGVSPQMFRRLMMQACEEQVQESGVPTREQIGLVMEPIWYRFFVRLLWGLPSRLQNAVLLSYSISKKFSKEQQAPIRELLLRGLSLPFSTSETELAQRFKELAVELQAFPEGFSERVLEFRRFVNRDWYNEKEMESIDMRTQLLLISWLRQDLLPQFLETLVVDALGKRFSYMPEVDFSLVPQLTPNSVPITVFFKKTDPLPGMRIAAMGLGLSVVHLMPLAILRETGARGDSKLRKSLKTLSLLCREKRWVILEAFEFLEVIEVEAIYKSFSELVRSEIVHPEFRLWLLFSSPPRSLPNWRWLIQHSFRLCFPDPKTIRERVILTQAEMSQKLHETMSVKTRTLYGEHGQTGMQFSRKQAKRMTRINPVLRGPLTRMLQKAEGLDSMISPRSVRRTLTLGKESPQLPDDPDQKGSIPDFLRFNLTLVVAIIDLRSRFAHDLPLQLSWREVELSIDEAIKAFGNASETRLKETVLDVISLFGQLLGPAWNEFNWYAAMNIMKHCLIGNGKVMHFTPVDGCGDSMVVEYPLYQLAGAKIIERLMFEMPKYDHLQLVGLPHIMYREAQYKASSKLARTLRPPPSSPSEPRGLASLLHCHLSRLQATIALYSPSRPAIDYETAYESSNLSRMKRYSYFFVPDRYRTSDFKSKVLVSPPSLSTLLDTLQLVNETRFDDFLREVENSLKRTSEYLDYSKAQLAYGDEGVLAELTKDKTPESWLRAGPYSLRYERSPDTFISRLTRPVTDYHGVISLNQVMDPPGLIYALLRCFSFITQQDFELTQFEICEHTGTLPENSVLLSDLHLFNAALRGELLKDSYNAPPLAMGVCRCTAVLERKEVAEAHPRPAGAVLYYKAAGKESLMTDVEKEDNLSELAQSAFHYARSEMIELHHPQSAAPYQSRLNKVVCPMFQTRSGSAFWIVFHSEQPQSHWAKRGVKVDLI